MVEEVLKGSFPCGNVLTRHEKCNRKKRKEVNKMEKKKITKPFMMVFAIYILYYVLHVTEVFLLRTDQTWIGEAVFHKFLGIVIMAIIAFMHGYKAEEIGFLKGKNILNVFKGLAFGFGVFVIAYTTEIIIAKTTGSYDSLKFYVSAYAIDKNIGNRTEIIFFIICIVGNIINVLMEEGNFRGLFLRILGEKYAFTKAAIISSVLFGFWHIVSPIRNYVDGEQSLTGTIFNATFLLVASALVGLKFTMLTKMTGSIYMSMGDHFFNNTIVNLLHVVTKTGADELMTVRVSIAQSLSFVIVLICYCKWRRKNALNNEREAGFRAS